MNMQRANVRSDLSGVSGMAIVQAILGGERDPKVLAALADPQVKAPREAIAKSLPGNGRDELLWVLQQEVEMYRMYQERMRAGDLRLQGHLKSRQAKVDLTAQPWGPRPQGQRARGNAPQFDWRTARYRISGVDWTPVDGIDVQVAQSVIAEVGVDLRAFPSEKHFANWLGLCPTSESSGGKVLRR